MGQPMKIRIKLFLLVYKLLLIPCLVSGQGMVISSGSHVVVGTGYVGIFGNLTNNGSYTDQGGTLVLTGNTQNLTGTNGATLNNLNVSSGSTSTLSTAGQTVKGVLTCDGTLNAGGNLTLLSTADQTALVSGAGAGTINGNVTMQRYLASGFGYKYFSSPFQAATVSEFADDMNLGAAFPTFYSYNENRDTTWWITYTTGTNLLVPMLGYAVNFGPSADPKTADVTGAVSNGTMSLTLYNHDKNHTKGFTLVGNPYPSPVDWDAATGWTKTNIDNAVYYFNAGSADQYVGSYSTYINGVSSDGIANNIIPAMQGFFVHVTNGTFPVTGTLGFSNQVRINTLNPVFHKNGLLDYRPLIRISAGFEGAENRLDPLVVLFDGEASPLFNERQDAVKLMNTDPEIPSFYTLSNDNIRYAIKSLPEPADSLTVIPLGITTQQQGIIDFAVNALENQQPGLQLYFSDNKNRAVLAVNSNTRYQAFLDEGVCDGRFSLILSRHEIPTSSGSADELDAYYSDGKIYVYCDFLNNEQGELQVSDMLGRIIHREKVTGIGYNSVNLNVPTGIYIASLRSEHASSSKKLFIPGK